MEDIDAMFTDMLQEMDLLTQSLDSELEAPESTVSSQSSQHVNYSIGFSDLNASLHELEDNDLDTLMADLVADLSATEEKFAAERGGVQEPRTSAGPAVRRVQFAPDVTSESPLSPPESDLFAYQSNVPGCTPAVSTTLPPAPSLKTSSEDAEAQMKADKIKLALEKLKEAKVKKLIVKVELTDGSSKTLMVDERQTVRDVIDNLFEKMHCDGNVDWCLCETNPELQIDRGFEDHENLVEPLSAWTRDSENKVVFHERKDKYEVFKNPQKFYMWKKDKKSLKDMKEKDKDLLLEENFGGQSVIVPDLEGVLHLKEEGKKSWKPRYFILRASGMYYSPKGKTKASRDLVCFVQFDNMNVYYCNEYKSKYKAPTEHCFILKHPQIQKESQYIKYLCCDDQWTLDLWVTGIRIAKYGKTLYDNYKGAVRRGASLSSVWTNLNHQPSASTSKTSTPSPTPNVKAANGHAPQPCAETVPKVPSNKPSFPPPPSMNNLPPPPTDLTFPAPPPPPPPMSVRGQPLSIDPGVHHTQTAFLPPPPDLPLPPPPSVELPPDFLPPPPPAMGGFCGGELPPPPPPPPPPGQNFPPPPPPPALTAPVFNPPGAGGDLPPPPPPPPPALTAPAVRTTPTLKKLGPMPPARTSSSVTAPSGGDFMSELMLAMQKKRTGP